MSFKDAIAKKAQGLQAQRETKEKTSQLNVNCIFDYEIKHVENCDVTNGHNAYEITANNHNLGKELTNIGAFWLIGQNKYYLVANNENRQKLFDLLGIELVAEPEPIKETKAPIKMAPWIDESDSWQKYKAQLQALEEYLNIDLPAIQLRAIDCLYRETIGGDKLN